MGLRYRPCLPALARRLLAGQFRLARPGAEAERAPQFKTTIDGLKIHFVHIKSKEPGAFPLALTHGWPGSFFELTKIVDPLTDPVKFGGRATDAFDVRGDLAAWLRVLRQAAGARLQPGENGVDHREADGAARLRALRRTRRRLGRHHQPAGGTRRRNACRRVALEFCSCRAAAGRQFERSCLANRTAAL
jgi:hypothetical protein